MRASTNITLKERSTLTLEDFKGVDFTSSPYRIAPNRAVDAVNLIYENGTNRKRKGWRQRLSSGNMLKNGLFTEPVEIDGIFHYRHGEEDTVLIVAGNQIYGYSQEEDRCGTLLWYDRYDEYAHPAGRCQFFMNRGWCYILSEKGDIFVYGEFEDIGVGVKPLAELYYIPTTTVSIEPDGVTDGNVAALERPNVLTPRRKNGIHSWGGSVCQYTLDAPIDPNAPMTVSASYIKTEDHTFEKKLVEKTLVFATDGGYDQSLIKYLDGYNVKGWLVDQEGYSYGAVMDWGNYENGERNCGKIVLIAMEPPDEFSNITVEFQVASSVWQYDAKMIDNCTFGTLFGMGGNTDRLFLGGNPDYPNQVFYSGFDDLTYFPDDGALVVGSDHSPVNGFVRMSDNALAVLKPESDSDSTVFYITGTQHNQYDSEGNLSGGKTVFTVASGGAGEGNSSPYTTASLAGEAIFLGTDSVYAVSPSENATTGVRNVRERGQPVARKLRQRAQGGAAIVFDNRYYLSVDGGCYVADARHKYDPAESGSEQGYQYEWWYWDNVPARVWAVIDGVLWFGTEDGRVCSFDREDYADETFFRFQAGDLTANDDTVVYDEKWRDRLCEGDLLEIPEEKDGVKRMRRLIITDLHECVTESGASCTAFRLKEYADDEHALTGLTEMIPTGEPVTCYHRQTVTARWVSPYLSLGSGMHEKTLLGLSVTAGQGSGRFQFGYESKRSSDMLAVRGIDTLRFDDFSFARFSFGTGFASSHTVRMNVRNINYLRFCFSSEIPEEMTVESLTALYKINRMNRGVR